MDLLNRRFGETLRELRTERLITQEQLSRSARMDRAYISEMERGLHLPSVASLVRLADALGVTASELLRRVEQRRSRRTRRRLTSSQALSA